MFALPKTCCRVSAGFRFLFRFRFPLTTGMKSCQSNYTFPPNVIKKQEGPRRRTEPGYLGTRRFNPNRSSSLISSGKRLSPNFIPASASIRFDSIRLTLINDCFESHSLTARALIHAVIDSPAALLLCWHSFNSRSPTASQQDDAESALYRCHWRWELVGRVLMMTSSSQCLVLHSEKSQLVSRFRWEFWVRVLTIFIRAEYGLAGNLFSEFSVHFLGPIFRLPYPCKSQLWSGFVPSFRNYGPNWFGLCTQTGSNI